MSIIQHKEILKAHRFDAEYFQIQDIIKKIEIMSSTKLEDSSDWITQGPNPMFSQKGTPCLTGRNISTGKVVFKDSDIIDEEEYQKLRRFTLKNEDILITLKGAGSTGKIALFNSSTKSIFSRNIGLVRLRKSAEISPGFLFVFFSSSLGQKIIDRGVTGGTGQRTLPTGFLKRIKIPLLSQSFQLQIEEKVKDVHQKDTQSQKLYREAKQLLLKELGFVNFKPKQSLTFEATSKGIKQVRRFDAEYFQPKYKEIIKKIEKYNGGFGVIKNIVNWEKGIEVGTQAYTEQGKEFVRVSDFSIFGIEKTSRKISEGLFEEIKKRYQPKKGDILFTKDGTIGLSYVLREDIEGVLSSAFLRLTLKKEYQYFKKECLALIFNSTLSKMQVEQLSGGAVIAHLKPSDFEKFKIPLIKPQIQIQIAEKIKESHKLRKESKELLEEAKRKVEEEIEKK